MGTPNAEFPAWVCGSDALSHEDMCETVKQHRVKIRELANDSRARVDSIVERCAGYGVHDTSRADCPEARFLRLEGDFVGCPYCVATNNRISPIRQGQLTCCVCWEVIQWRTTAGARPVDVQAAVSSRAIVNEEHSARLAQRYDGRVNVVGEQYRVGSRARFGRKQRWDKGNTIMIDEDTNLQYRVLGHWWSDAGAPHHVLAPAVEPC
jgi:hypothetical protein